MIKKAAILLCVGLSLISCKPAPTPRDLAEPHFMDKQPIMLQVGKVEFGEDYKPVGKYPNVEHLFAYPPADVFHQWVEDRIAPRGGPNRLEVIVKEASVRETSLPVTKGIKGVFTNDQAEKYDAELSVEMRLYVPGKALSIADANARATKTMTIAENATLEERDRLFYDLTLSLVNELSIELERNMRQYFAAYIIP